MILRCLLASIGAICILIGMLLVWTPLPLGAPLFMIGVPLLMRYSPRGRKFILHMLDRFPYCRDKAQHFIKPPPD